MDPLTPAGRAEPDTPPPVRIALVLASSTGGVGRHLRSLSAGLVDRGYMVTVAGPAATNDLFDYRGAGAEFVPVEIPASPQARDIRTVGALRRMLLAPQRPPVSLLHAHGLRAGLVAAAARPGSLPLVVTWHNAVLATGARGTAYRLIERYVAGAAAVNLAASSDLVERVTALGGLDVRLSPVAAPTLPPPRRARAEVREELGISDEQPLVLSVGRLHPQKRHDLLIKAAARWNSLRPAPVVAIAGSGPSFLALTNLIQTSRAPVLLLGHRTDVADLLEAADIAVVSSDWEARQLFAQEAMMAGLPLVATGVGGLPELVGDAALLVPPGDVDALASSVRGLLVDAAARASWAQRSKAQAATWPTEQDTIEAIVAVYQELLAGGTG
jgi:glycosyltransferase involved in cell wall biosynthesis